MKNTKLIAAVITLFSIFSSCKVSKNNTATSYVNTEIKDVENVPKNNILVFSKTNGWAHKSIPSGIEALKKMGSQNMWKMDFTKDSLSFNSQNLAKYDAILFLNTTGDILGEAQEKAFEEFIKNGGDFVGVHAATDTEHDWPFYAEMIGAQFESHPKTQTATVKVNKQILHPSIANYDAIFKKFDEWYNFKKEVLPHVNILLELDETSYEGERMGTRHPIAWYHVYEGGRIFYTGMGHDEATYSDAEFLKHLQGGINWALHKEEVKLPNSGKNLLEDGLSNWDIWMGAPHVSVVDLDGFEKTEEVTQGTPIGINKDPKNIFSIIEEGGEKVLKITGEIYAGLTTKDEYSNYHFTTQFKWGEKKWEPRLDDKRDSGILYHAQGKHGAFWNVWMASLEFQVQESDCGDFIALGDVYGDVAYEEVKNDKGESSFVYNPKMRLKGAKWGDQYKTGYIDASEMHENPNGEWNTLEIICVGRESIHLVNGHIVNSVKNARYDVAGKTIPITSGKIQIQSEAAEVYYKNMHIKPVTKFPSKYKNF